MQRQMEMFQEGGLEQDGGTVDPVSGNDVPTGSSQEEVRDDIPAQLSEGEFVFPADVVRFIGLEKLMMMRQEAKAGLKRMEDMGQMGNSEEATIPDDIPFDINDLELEDDSIPAYKGGAIQSFETGGMSVTEGSTVKGQDFSTQPIKDNNPISQISEYTPPTVGDTPVQAPTDPIPPFDVFVPPVADDYKEYVNDEGIIINVPYFRGNILPGYSLPQGYTLKEEESVVPEQEGILTDITQEPERDREREIQVAEEEKEQRNRSYDNMISQFLDKNPNASLEDITKGIKGGEGEINLFGKVIKAPGFLFDEDMIRRRYNLVQDKYSFPEEDKDIIDTGEDAEGFQDVKLRKAEAKAEANKQAVILEAQNKRLAEANIAAAKAKEQRKAEAKANRQKVQEKQGIRGTPLRDKDINRDDPFEKTTGIRRAKGGIIEKPKPKKKTMKRGGLASKK